MIEDTSKRDPLLNMAFLANQPGRGIEEMEAAGQAQLVNSAMIPTKLIGCTEGDLIGIGFTLGPPDATDPLFRPAGLPAGWSREASDHDMWSYLVDETGTRRFGMFYKAAFYDRSAHLQPSEG